MKSPTGSIPRWPAVLGLLISTGLSLPLVILAVRWDASHSFSGGKMAFMGLMLSGVVLSLFGCMTTSAALLWRGSPSKLDRRRAVLRRCSTVLLFLMLALWASFMFVEFTQGSASGGKVVAGQHYLGSHGKFMPATPAKFRYVEWHEFLFFPMILTALLAAVGRVATEPASRSRSPAVESHA